jgi:hypothetical protein
MSKPKGERYTVAVDFDGVLHSYTTPWIDAVTIPDPPVPGAMEWLQQISDDFQVIVFTTRGKTDAGKSAVMEWVYRHSGLTLPVAAEKPPALIYLDDRAYRFEGPGTFPSAEQIHRARPWNKR